MASNAKKTYEQRAQSEPTQLHKDFAQWIYEETGIRPDLKSVQLACALRMDYQRSDANQTALKAKKQAAAAKAAKIKADKIAKAKATLAKLQAEIAAEEAPSMPASKPAPRKRATAKAPVKAAEPTPKASAKASEAPAPAKPRSARTRRTVAAKKTAESTK